MSPSNSPGKSPATWLLITVLLLAAILGSLWVPLYARAKPMLGAFPFFYWYQLALVPAVAIVSWLAYLLLRSSQSRAGQSSAGQPSDGPEADR